MKDKNGNSVLHVATWKKQHLVVEWLVGNGTTPSALEVNIVNQSGLTPLDLLLIFPSEAGDREIEEILRGAGASRAQDIHHTPSHCPMEINALQLQQPNDPMEYFKFKKGRDSPSDARTALLVIAVLVATTTFQAGLSPPMGIWQDSPGSNMNGTGSGSNEPARTAGKSIMSSYNILGFFFFYASNSIGLSFSLYMIHVLTTNFPLQLELNICMFTMFLTYYSAIFEMGPENMSHPVFALTMPALVALVRVWYAKCTRLDDLQ